MRPFAPGEGRFGDREGEEGQQQDGEPEREDGLRRSPGPRCREAEAPWGCDVGRYLRPA